MNFDKKELDELKHRLSCVNEERQALINAVEAHETALVQETCDKLFEYFNAEWGMTPEDWASHGSGVSINHLAIAIVKFVVQR